MSEYAQDTDAPSRAHEQSNIPRVSIFSGRLAIKSLRAAHRAASHTSKSLASGLPYTIFSRIVVLKSTICWAQTPISLRNVDSWTSLTSMPFTRTEPESASYRRRRSREMVLLPDPVAPTLLQLRRDANAKRCHQQRRERRKRKV
jgi:hypothetical protein